MDWAAAIWLWPYLGVMTLISYLGQFDGGRMAIPFYWDMVVVTAWSLIVYYTAIRLRLPEEKVDRYAQGVYGFES
jgi:hypothetical protein